MEKIENILIIIFCIGAVIGTALMLKGTKDNIDYVKAEHVDMSVEEYIESAKVIQINEPTPIEKPVIMDSVIQYMTKCVIAEAGNQDEIGKRLVADVILNRWESEDFPNTIPDVINQPYQFEVTQNNQISNVEWDWSVYTLVCEEIENRTNNEVLYFRTGNYHYGLNPLFKHGDHYFSN